MTRELSAIVRNQTLGHFETAHNVLPHELLNLVCGDLCEWLCLYPLCEILNGDDQKLQLPYCQGEGSQDVNSPGVERPGAVN